MILNASNYVMSNICIYQMFKLKSDNSFSLIVHDPFMMVLYSCATAQVIIDY